jgi:hypothetical protein
MLILDFLLIFFSGEDVPLSQDPSEPDVDIITWKGTRYKIDHIKLEGTIIEGSPTSPFSDPVR